MQTPKVSQDFFVTAGQDVQKGDADYITLAFLSREQIRDRWKSQTGRFILTTWSTNRFDRKVLDGLVGKFYGHTDLRGIPLANAHLSGADLIEVDLFYADLRGARLDYANLTGSYLSEANLEGACFDWANMSDVLTDNAEFDNRSSFIGVMLRKIDFNLADQLKDFAFGQQRIASLKRKYPKSAFFLWLTCDYGRSFARFFAWCGGAILAFAIAYTVIPGALNRSGFWNGLYFSLMSFFTQGSDVQAVSVIGKLLVSLESAIGYLMTGLLISILVKRTIGD